MPHSHGGFFVRSLEPHVAERVRLALKAALHARDLDTRKLHLRLSAERACPVLHLSIGDRLADPRDEAALHRDHLGLGADLARAADADVWAYHCAHGDDVELVQHFAPDGAAGAPMIARPAAAPAPTPPSAAQTPRGDDALPTPLRQLAATLGVTRDVLETLAVGPSRLDLALASASPCTEAIATYLSGALRPPIVLSTPDRKLAPSDVEESLYFPGWMGEELVALAHRLRVNLGTLIWSAWEAAKPRLYQTTPLFDDYPPEGSLPPAPRIRPAPASKPPTNLTLPTDVPLLARPLDARDKAMLTMMLPARVRAELHSFALGSDKPVSWIVQQAILLVRHRLLAATAR